MRAPNSGSRSLQRRGHPQCHSPLNEGAIPGMALSAAASLPGFDTGQRTANTCIARRRIGAIWALELLRRAQNPTCPLLPASSPAEWLRNPVRLPFSGQIRAGLRAPNSATGRLTPYVVKQGHVKPRNIPVRADLYQAKAEITSIRLVFFSTDKDQFAGAAQIGGHTGGGGTPPNEGVGVPSRTERWGDALKLEPAAKAAVTAEMARIRFKVLSFLRAFGQCVYGTPNFHGGDRRLGFRVIGTSGIEKHRPHASHNWEKQLA